MRLRAGPPVEMEARPDVLVEGARRVMVPSSFHAHLLVYAFAVQSEAAYGRDGREGWMDLLTWDVVPGLQVPLPLSWEVFSTWTDETLWRATRRAVPRKLRFRMTVGSTVDCLIQAVLVLSCGMTMNDEGNGR